MPGTPSKMVVEAHAKGFKPVTKLWREVLKTVPCTPAQFSKALSDNMEDIPSFRRIRAEASRILDGVSEVCELSFAAKCAGHNTTVEQVYKRYIEENPDVCICYERFRQAAASPYTLSDYRIAKAGDEILAKIAKEKEHGK